TVQQRIFEAFGGKRGQWVVLVADPNLEGARERADRLVAQLGTMHGDVESVDALTAIAPSKATQEARLAARDAPHMPAGADDLERARRETGFLPERFAGALAAMRRPPRDEAKLADLEESAASILVTRYLGEDEGDHLVALYLRPTDAAGATDRIEEALRV